MCSHFAAVPTAPYCPPGQPVRVIYTTHLAPVGTGVFSPYSGVWRRCQGHRCRLGSYDLRDMSRGVDMSETYEGERVEGEAAGGGGSPRV